MNFRDYISFINEMQVLVNADELAKDVAGAKALLERHQEHKVYQLIFTLLSTFANFGFSILRSKSRVVMCVASKGTES